MGGVVEVFLYNLLLENSQYFTPFLIWVCLMAIFSAPPQCDYDVLQISFGVGDLSSNISNS